MKGVFAAVLLGSSALFAVGMSQEISLPAGARAVGFAWSPGGAALAVFYLVGEYPLDVESFCDWYAMPGGELLWRKELGVVRLKAFVPPSVAFSPDGTELAVGAIGGIVVLSTADGAIRDNIELVGPHGAQYVVALGRQADGTLAALLSDRHGFSGNVYLDTYDREGKRRERITVGPSVGIRAAFSSDGERLVYTPVLSEPGQGSGTKLEVYHLDTGSRRILDLTELFPQLPWDESGVVTRFAFRPDGREIAASIFFPPTFILGLDPNGSALWSHPIATEERFAVMWLSYGPSGNIAFHARSPQTFLSLIGILDPRTGNTEVICKELPPGCPYTAPVISPDGRKIVLGWWDRVWLQEVPGSKVDDG